MTIIRCEYSSSLYDLDVLDETPIRVDVSAIENNAIGEVFGAASQQFTLPASKKNNQFFKHAYKVGVDSVPGLGESVPCWVISDSDTLIEGSLYLDEVVKTSNGGYNYEVTIVNNIVTFNELVKRVAVKDLGWNEYTHSLSITNITSSWDNGLFGGDVFYPLVDYGRDGNETTASLPNVAFDPSDTPAPGYMNNATTPLQPNQFSPAIRVKTVLDKIFAYGDFSYETSLTDLFNNTYILPKQTEDLSVKGSGFTGFGFVATKTTFIDDQITANSGYYTASIETETFDEANRYSTSEYTYTVGKSGTYQFGGSFNVDLDPEDTNPTLIGRIRDVTNGVTLGSTQHNPTSLQTTFTVETNEVNLFYNTEVQLQLAYIQGTGEGLLDAYLTTGSEFYTVKTPINYSTGIVQLGEQFDPQTKCSDILSGLIQKFNLVFEPDYTKNKVIKIDTYETWLGKGNRKDWSRKIQQADRIGIRSPLSSQQKTLIFEDAKDNDKLSKEVIDNAEGFQWGTEVVDAISNVPQGEKNIGEYFAPVILDRIPGGNTTDVVPQLYKTDNTEIGRKTFKHKPRIGYKVGNGLSKPAYIGYDGISFQNYATLSNYNQLPVTASVTKNLHFNDSFYTPTFTSVTGSVTAYDEYYNNYISDLYREDNKILSADIEFEPTELRNINLNDVIFVNDNWYRINKIKGFNLNQKDVVNVELIGIRNIPALQLDCAFDFNTQEVVSTTTLIPPVQPSTTEFTTLPITTSTTTIQPTTTTTAAPTTTTTTSTTVAPTKFIELTINNNTSTSFVSESNAAELKFNEYDEFGSFIKTVYALRSDGMPTGSSYTSSIQDISGSLQLRGWMNYSLDQTWGPLYFTRSLYLDNVLYDTQTNTYQYPNSSSEIIFGGSGNEINTNLFTSYSMEVEINAPTTTTTTTTTAAKLNQYFEINLVNNTSTTESGTTPGSINADINSSAGAILDLNNLSIGTNFTSSIINVDTIQSSGLPSLDIQYTAAHTFPLYVTASLYGDGNLLNSATYTRTNPGNDILSTTSSVDLGLYATYSANIEFNN